MASYYQFKTDDAEALVPALMTYSGSECRKRVPAQIRLMSEHFNGDEEATHTVIYGFGSPADLQTSFEVQGSCPEFARLWSVISKHTVPTSQSLGMLLSSGGDPTKDSVYQIWQMTISDEAKYVEEYNKMQEARAKAGLVNGAWGLVRFMAGSDSQYTHFRLSGFARSNDSRYPSGGQLDLRKVFAKSFGDPGNPPYQYEFRCSGPVKQLIEGGCSHPPVPRSKKSSDFERISSGSHLESGTLSLM